MTQGGSYTVDLDAGVVHVCGRETLARCHQSFAANFMHKDVSGAVPTCVFCIAGLIAGLPQWRFLPKGNTYRRVIEENRDA